LSFLYDVAKYPLSVHRAIRTTSSLPGWKRIWKTRQKLRFLSAQRMRSCPQSYLSVITLEYVTGKGIVEQLSTGGWVPAVVISSLIGIGSVVPLFKGYTNDDWPGKLMRSCVLPSFACKLSAWF
jgi:hypothetical protein